MRRTARPAVPSAAEVHLAWHDLECGAYTADLPLWRELAAQAGGAVIDVGAGAGRVTLDLLSEGHAVTALDHDPLLLAALRERAGDLPGGAPEALRTVEADAREFAVDEAHALCLLPMQTIQLVHGPEERAAVLRCCRAALRPGGLLAMAIATRFQAFDAAAGMAPGPDVLERRGVVFESHAVAVRLLPGRARLERERRVRVGGGLEGGAQARASAGDEELPGGTLTGDEELLDGALARGEELLDGGDLRVPELDVIELDRVTRRALEREARAAGFRILPHRSIAETADHVGSTVVMLGV